MLDKSLTKMMHRRIEAKSWLGNNYHGYGSHGFINPPKHNNPGRLGGYGVKGQIIPPSYRKAL